MKNIEIDDELYYYIARQTQHIGESASSILRRLLNIEAESQMAAIAINPEMKPRSSRDDYGIINELVESDAFIKETKSVNRFLSILAVLHAWNSSRFSLAAASLHGSKRRYLAISEAALLEHGKTTKPKAINGTSYWVVTNNNTARKSYIIESIMKNMDFPSEIITHVLERFIVKSGV